MFIGTDFFFARITRLLTSVSGNGKLIGNCNWILKETVVMIESAMFFKIYVTPHWYALLFTLGIHEDATLDSGKLCKNGTVNHVYAIWIQKHLRGKYSLKVYIIPKCILLKSKIANCSSKDYRPD
jgi:hypothetical protein